MKTRCTTKHLLLASSVIVLGLASSAASYAAFEWTPPAVVNTEEKAAASAEEVDPLAPVPVEGVEEETLPIIPADNATAEDMEKAPVEYIEGEEPKTMTMKVPADSEVAEDLKEIIEEAEDSNMITPVAEIPEEEQIDTMPQEAEKLVSEAEDMAEMATAPEADLEPSADLVQGFGKDLPLITAIRQIIPTDTPYAVGENVDMGTLVSWEGGQTWQKTIEGIAAANNMQVAYENDLVRITEFKEGMMAKAEMPEIETVRIESVQESIDEPVAVVAEETEVIVMQDQEPVALVEVEEIASDMTPEPEMVEVVDAEDELLTLEEVIRVADAEIKAATNVSAETDVEEAEAEEMVVEETAAAPAEDIIVVEEELEITEIEPKEVVEEAIIEEDIIVMMEDNMADENEILEATISEAIVISPIEDLDESVAQRLPADVPADSLSTVSEGMVISRIDEPETTETFMAPSQDALEPAAPELEDDVMSEAEAIIIEEDVLVVPDTEEVMEDVIEAAAEEGFEEVEVIVEEQATIIEPVTEEIAMVEPTVDPMPLQIEAPSEEEALETAAAPVEIEPASAASMQQMVMEPVNIDVVKTWKVKKNSDLKKTLEQWSEEVGVDLQWNMQQDYTVDYMVWVDGSFQEAIDVLMQGYSNEKGLIPAATLMQGPTGKPVLVIEPAA